MPLSFSLLKFSVSPNETRKRGGSVSFSDSSYIKESQGFVHFYPAMLFIKFA